MTKYKEIDQFNIIRSIFINKFFSQISQILRVIVTYIILNLINLQTKQYNIESVSHSRNQN